MSLDPAWWEVFRPLSAAWRIDVRLCGASGLMGVSDWWEARLVEAETDSVTERVTRTAAGGTQRNAVLSVLGAEIDDLREEREARKRRRTK